MPGIIRTGVPETETEAEYQQANLRCEYFVNPLAIDSPRPRL